MSLKKAFYLLSLLAIISTYSTFEATTKTKKKKEIKRTYSEFACIYAKNQPEKIVPAMRDKSLSGLLLNYHKTMSKARKISTNKNKRHELRKSLKKLLGLNLSPQNLHLDVFESKEIDHPWCRVKRVSYQIWPGVYASGLLYKPKITNNSQAPPAMLCPHGHWQDGNMNPIVQRRCLNFARLGYVTFSPDLIHYEDFELGISDITVMTWSNMRAIDYLETLQTDKGKLGVSGGSGGGLQTEMLVALDPRVKSATILGYTCNINQMMYPKSITHCNCNHIPGFLKLTDHPEVSTLGLPVPIQYLTMNDWTKSFQEKNFPKIKQLYTTFGANDRVACQYFNSKHEFNKPKRIASYKWAQRWLKGISDPIVDEPETEIIPLAKLKKLKFHRDTNKFARVSKFYESKVQFKTPELKTKEEYLDYKDQMIKSLRTLLGEDSVAKPVKNNSKSKQPIEIKGKVLKELCHYPTEGELVAPAFLLQQETLANKKKPVIILLSSRGKDWLIKAKEFKQAEKIVNEGNLVVIPDLRNNGQLFSLGDGSVKSHKCAWERNSIVWGRPLPGMAVTDLIGILNGVCKRADVDANIISIIALDSSASTSALFTAILDPRLKTIELNFEDKCFKTRTLPTVPNILKHGDILEFSSLLADRNLTLKKVPKKAGDRRWLADVFKENQNAAGLH